MARRRKDIDEDAFRELDRVFRANEHSDLLVRAFNTLGADDRALMLAYLSCGRNAAVLTRQLGVSRPMVDDRLWRIRVVVIERYRKLLAEVDDFES